MNHYEPTNTVDTGHWDPRLRSRRKWTWWSTKKMLAYVGCLAYKSTCLVKDLRNDWHDHLSKSCPKLRTSFLTFLQSYADQYSEVLWHGGRCYKKHRLVAGLESIHLTKWHSQWIGTQSLDDTCISLRWITDAAVQVKGRKRPSMRSLKPPITWRKRPHCCAHFIFNWSKSWALKWKGYWMDVKPL